MSSHSLSGPEAPKSALFSSIALGESSERFYLRPSGSNQVLVIDRVSGELAYEADDGTVDRLQLRSISGIFGISHLLSGAVLVVITQKRMVGNFHGHTFWEIVETDILPFARSTTHLSEKQVHDENTYHSLLRTALDTPGLYFSYTYNMTLSLQRQQGLNQPPTMENIDQRFLWNRHALLPLTKQPELSSFVLPIVHGFMTIQSCYINGQQLDFALLSRRSIYRAGTRFNRRGIDEMGCVANHLETEQLVSTGKYLFSFLQTRGSLPLFWGQTPNLKYKPKMKISEQVDHIPAFRRHFEDQISRYGSNVCVNLIDQKGIENCLGETYASLFSSLSGQPLRYVAFDFHKECSKMRWERLSILMDQIKGDQDAFGYCAAEYSNGQTHIFRFQSGIVRTNCIDCLDRTNVVQSMLGARSLVQQLVQAGVIQSHETLDQFQEFKSVFQNVWADNADYCSIQYAGSGALKTDFTRTGKRTKLGLIQDGYCSLLRYYMNNFCDGQRQDSIDLVLGNYVPNQDEGITLKSLFAHDYDWPIVVPMALLISICMMLITAIMLPDTTYYYPSLFLWLICMAGSLLFISLNGPLYVDMPRLITQSPR